MNRLRRPKGNHDGTNKFRLYVAVAGQAGSSFNQADMSSLDEHEELPTICEMSDGRCLFYLRSVNILYGWTAEGKTWIALFTCVQEIRKRRHVLYLDYEDHARRINIKLLDLGLTREEIDTYFHYVHPQEGFLDSRGQLTEAAEAVMPVLERFIIDAEVSVIVIDSVGESMVNDGLNELDGKDVSQWQTLWVRPLASLGPAVILIDQVPKDPLNQKGPIGSGRKLYGNDGSTYKIVMAKSQPLGKHRLGMTNVIAYRDKCGNYVRNEDVASFRLDATTDPYEYSLDPFEPAHGGDDEDEKGWRNRSKCMKALDDWLERQGEEATANATAYREAVGMKFKARTRDQAVAWLVELGCWGRKPGRGNEKLHYRIKPFHEGMYKKEMWERDGDQEEADEDGDYSDTTVQGRLRRARSNGANRGRPNHPDHESDGKITNIRPLIRRRR
jgi:hypothetical protein